MKHPCTVFLFLLFLLTWSSTFSQATSSLDSARCTEMYNLLTGNFYEEMKARIDLGYPCECTGWDVTSRTPMRRGWFPGKVLISVLDRLTHRGNNVQAYTLLSEALQNEQSENRDQFLLVLIAKTASLRADINWWDIFMENSSNRNSTQIMEALSGKSKFEDQESAITTAFLKKFPEYIDWFTQKYGYHKSMYRLAAYSFGHDEAFFEKQLNEVGCFPAKSDGLKAERMLASSPHTQTGFVALGPLLPSQLDYERFILALKEHGAGFDYRDSQGHNLLQQAVAGKNPRLAMAFGNTLTWDWAVSDRNGQNLLHLAVPSKDLEILTYLKSKGVPLDKKDKTGKTPADYVEAWDVVLREMLGGKLSPKETNTMKVYHLALKKSTDYTSEDLAFVKALDANLDFDHNIQRPKGDYWNSTTSLNLLQLANSNQSYPLLYRLLQVYPHEVNIDFRKSNEENLAASNWEYFRNVLQVDQNSLTWFRKEVMDAYKNLKTESPKAHQMLQILQESGYQARDGSFYDHWNQPLVMGTFEKLLPFDKSPLTLYMRGGKWGIVALDGHELTPPRYEKVERVATGYGTFGARYYFECQEGSSRKLLLFQYFLSIGKEFEEELPPGKITRFEMGERDVYLHTESGGKKGLLKIDYKTLKPLLSCQYDEIVLLGQGTFDNKYKVKQNGLYSTYSDGMAESYLKFKYEDISYNPTTHKFSGLKKGKWKEI
ncbi:MAG: ankyrin repeat domain-containing protein [Bacteroidia bacterium]|nr:ankyrin repeat domain-containing protein [Bacteroidia bacterium]